VERLRALLQQAAALPREIAPPRDLWPGVATRLRRRGVPPPWWLAAAAAVILALGALFVFRDRLKAGGGWPIARVEGRATIDGAPLMRSVLRPGDALRTGTDSRVRLEVGGLGTVAVAPETRVRLLAARPDEQRLALDHGTIEARIVAPARVFLVETPVALAVDLGCAYVLTVDSLGNGLLHVTSGWVELARGGRVTVVPRDAHARTRAGVGPGTAYPPDAPPAFVAALDAYDFGAGAGRAAAARAVLRAAARRVDAITLLNLLAGVEDSLRGAVYERLAALAPPPVGVTREGALALDRRMLNRWWNEVVPPRLERDPRDPKGRINASVGLDTGVVVAPPPRLAVERVAAGLTLPLHLTAPPLPGDARLFVVEQSGRIRIVRNGTLVARPFLDIVARVGSGGERGLLSLAFHPRYAENGWFFVNYTDRNGDTRVERYRVSDDPDVADPASAALVLGVPQPYANHNGGHILFGPDGMLYVGMGDGGSGGDPHGNGQDLGTLLGKVLRLDVDRAEPYAVPPDNPFVNRRGARGEIWAYGLRNPWRLAFDRPSGLLYIADVGQNRWEEVNVQPAALAGLNYGWSRMEGDHCFGLPFCLKGGLVRPALEYGHDEGCSITGGLVYRGRRLPGLRGHYFYSDYCTGFLRSFSYADGAVVGRYTWDVGPLGAVLSFGEDADGELYVLSASGTVYRLVTGP
jgi:glucose/arabinose dehydrogenase